MAYDETALLGRLRARDDSAYEKLVRENTGRMLRVARRMLCSEEDARDAVQDSFLHAFRGLEEFEGTASLATWLSRIVVNTCLMKLRSRRRRPERSIDELLPQFYEDGHRIDPGPPWRAFPEDPVATREVLDHVRACIDELPEIYRTALLLRDIEGIDAAEAASMLEIRPDALKRRVHRARQALRTLLDPRFVEEAA